MTYSTHKAIRLEGVVFLTLIILTTCRVDDRWIYIAQHHHHYYYDHLLKKHNINIIILTMYGIQYSLIYKSDKGGIDG